MQLATVLVCPHCHELGFGIRSKKVKTYHYDYFGHKIKKTNGRWRTKWCYLGKPNSQQELGHIRSDSRLVELGNKLGHLFSNTYYLTPIDLITDLSRPFELNDGPANSFYNVIPFNLGKITGPEGLEPSTSGSAGLRDSTTP